MSDIIFIHVGTSSEITARQIRPSAAFGYFISYMTELGYISKTILVSQNERYNKLTNLKTDVDIKGIILKEKPKISLFPLLRPHITRLLKY